MPLIKKPKAESKPKCLLCGKIAKYKEWSPDGATDYFCTIEHHNINRNYFYAKGISWRASELEKI